MIDETDRDDDNAMAAEYTLGLLVPAEQTAFEARLAVDPGLRALYARWAEDFAALTDDIAPVTPPKSVRTAIDARLFPQERQSWLRRVGLLPSLIGAFVAALLVVWVTTQNMLQPDPATGPRYTAQIAAEDQSLIIAASYDPASGSLLIDRSTGAARDGRALELWLIAGENPPVSLGVLPDTQTAVLPMDPTMVGSLHGGVFAITDEPAGGSSTGLPTGEVLATGQITTL